MADKVRQSSSQIEPGPKLGSIASRERFSSDLRELPIINFCEGRFDILLRAHHARRLRLLSIYYPYKENLAFYCLKVPFCWPLFCCPFNQRSINEFMNNTRYIGLIRQAFFDGLSL